MRQQLAIARAEAGFPGRHLDGNYDTHALERRGSLPVIGLAASPSTRPRSRAFEKASADDAGPGRKEGSAHLAARRLPNAGETETLVPPPRKTRFGSPLVLSRVRWVEPKIVAEITYLTWTADNLLRHTVYVGLREDEPAEQVRRER
jgi:ATP dependent DNA ligase C terminal region